MLTLLEDLETRTARDFLHPSSTISPSHPSTRLTSIFQALQHGEQAGGLKVSFMKIQLDCGVLIRSFRAPATPRPTPWATRAITMIRALKEEALVKQLEALNLEDKA